MLEPLSLYQETAWACARAAAYQSRAAVARGHLSFDMGRKKQAGKGNGGGEAGEAVTTL